jgi:hypothetical protein
MLKAIPMSLPIRAPVGVLSIELAREVKLTCLFERSRVTLAELEASISAQLRVSLNTGPIQTWRLGFSPLAVEFPS